MERSSSVFNNQFSISQFGEYYLPSVNRNTFEKVDSTTAFKQKFKQEIFKQDTLHIILGIDSGLLVNYILEAPLSEGSKYIFIELPAVLSMLNVDIPEDKQDYIKVLDFEGFNDHIETAKDDLFLMKDQLKVTLSLSASTGVIEEYSELYNRVSHLLTSYIESLKANLQQKLFFTEQMYNVVENRQPASLLKDSFCGKTCMVIGGGPSLDENIEWIKCNYNELFIITVSRFASKLSQLGIPAHIIVSIDPQEHSFEVNRDMMSLAKESLLINSHHICHRILAQWQGQSLFLGEQLPWSDTDNIPTIGPTVTNSAVRIAIKMGFNQILLSGVDFCHSSTGMTHAKGSVESTAGSNNSRIYQWVETYAGNLAETPIQLLHAAQTLEEEIALFPHVNVINLSKNAAKLKGITHSTTNKLIINPANCSPQQLLDMLPNSTKSYKNFLISLKQNLTKASSAFLNIKKLCDEALYLNSALKELNVNTHRYQSKINKIEKIEAEINRKYPIFSKLIKIYGYFEFSQFLTTKKSGDWSLQQMHTMTGKYYTAYYFIAENLHDLIQTSLEITASRLEEIKATPSITMLTSQWKKHLQPGRSRLWLSNQSPEFTSSLTDNENTALGDLNKEYQQQLTGFSHPYFSMKEDYENLDNTLAKIIDLKQRKNIPGLSSLADKIQPLMKDDSYAVKLFHLTNHYIHLINEDYESALRSVQYIAPADRTEVEMKQILMISLKLHQLDLAERTLSELTQYSDEYLPQHAHILSLQGNNQQALDMYLDFLDKYPTDESTLIKLGIFLAGLGEINGAKSAFEQILSFNPDNLTASNYLAQLT